MRQRKFGFGVAKVACLVGAFMAVSGCAEQRDGINRVQPNGLDKAFFVGEIHDAADDPVFLSRNFVVDATESQELVGISTASGVERVRWEITEDTLFARRAYSTTGGDLKGETEKQDGTVIAAYRILSHFDAIRDYNPSTGEQFNVLNENTRDRPWNERGQFRVDWSQNLVNSPTWTTMFFGSTFGSIKLSGQEYYVTDPDHEDAPHFDAEDGYFDITSHYLVEPEQLNFGSFRIPLCWLMGLMTGTAVHSCDPQEAVLRTSYWRLSEADPDDDFEPFINTQAPRQIFGNPGGFGDSASIGIITPPREDFSEQYGFTDEGLSRYMHTHNLWRKSHQTRGECEADNDCSGSGAVCLASGACSVPCDYAAKRDRDNNGTDDQCENGDTGYDGETGSQCSARNRCTIPYRDREVKTIAYYTNLEMPDDLQDTVDDDGDKESTGSSEQLIETWNQALQLTVARAREVECRRTGGDREACHEEFFSDGIQMVAFGGWGMDIPKSDEQALVTCHNPVRSYDSEEICGEEGSIARVGDIRKNFLIYWPGYTRAPYGGIGNWRADPLTGQIVGAAATTIGRSATQSAAQVRDILMISLGELDIEDITQGTPATLFQNVLREGREPRSYTMNEINAKVKSIDFDELRKHVQVKVPFTAGQSAAEAVQSARMQVSPSIGLAAQELAEYRAISNRLADTEFEAQMLDGTALVELIGASPDQRLTPELMEIASPLRGHNMGDLSILDQQLMQSAGLHGVCHFDHSDSVGNPDLYGLANYFTAKYPGMNPEDLAEAIYEDLWREVYKGIQLHEIGHSLGLLHNFTSSYDSVNYNPQYWQLRTHDGASTASCEGEPRDSSSAAVANDSCMGPRYLDPETDDELGNGAEPRPGINYFGHTSTMEYQNTRFFETVGLGQYDVMAVGALYGRVLETLDTDEHSLVEQSFFEDLNRTQLTEDLLTSEGQVHYTELARRMELFDASRCRDATDDEKAEGEWRIVHGKVCAPPSKDVAHWDDFIDQSADGTIGKKIRVENREGTSARDSVRWPYRFGGDRMNGFLHVNPFDSGADPYEVTIEAIRKNDYNYPFTYFRRQRRGWSSFGLPGHTGRMFYERLRSYHWGISFTNAFFDDISRSEPRVAGQIEDIKNDDNQLRPYLLAQDEMLKAISRMFLTPEVGIYSNVPNRDGVYDLQGIIDNTVSFQLDASQGRFIAPAFDSTPTGGGSYDFQQYVRRGGFRMEKAMASRTLTDGRSVFFSSSRDIFLDSRNININFRSDMPVAVDRLLGGILSEDWESVGPYTASTANPEIEYRDLGPEAPDSLPAGARIVHPNLGYDQQSSTLIFAHLFARVNTDLTLANKMRIWIEGNFGASIDLPEAELIRFTNPLTGITYTARRFGREMSYGKSIELGIGSRMLERADTLLRRAFRIVEDEAGNPVVDEFGRTELMRDESGSPVSTDDEAARVELVQYVGLIDASVQINQFVGYGPFNFF